MAIVALNRRETLKMIGRLLTRRTYFSCSWRDGLFRLHIPDDYVVGLPPSALVYPSPKRLPHPRQVPRTVQ
jgi:hypothetical protein